MPMPKVTSRARQEQFGILSFAMTERSGFHSRAALLSILLATLLAGTPVAGWSAGPQGAPDSAATVVAAWTFVHGAARPDPAVSVAAGKRHDYGLVEAYVWNALPPDVRGLVSRLELFVSTSSAEDATDGTATENDDGVTWTLALDANEGEDAVVGGKLADRQVFDEVVAHEIGHVISLNGTQQADDTDVPGYTDEDGAFRMGAWLSRFYFRFWKGLYPHESPRVTGKAVSRVHQDAQAFVTDYAATDPSEDFAESFAYFVLDPAAPTGAAGKDRKIQFFYRYPALVRDRAWLRKGLSSVR